MKKKDLTRVLIETTVRGTLRKIHESPERETRNLIDFGLNFSSGRFQKKFLAAAQNMLRDENSAYYDLVKNVAARVEEGRLMAFGINLGYEGCTKGAKVIRAIEAERNFNIPWSLSLAVNADKLDTDPAFYPSLLRQGTALGIHTYFLFVTGDPSKMIPLLNGQPDCAFVLFLQGGQITDSVITRFEPVKHVMFSVCDGKEMAGACEKMESARFLYAVHERYTERDRERILSGNWLESVLPSRPFFALLLPDLSCGKETQQEVYSYIVSVRDGQKYPLIFMDIKHDTLMIDKVISDDVCMAGFDENGNMRTHEGVCPGAEYNIFSHDLESILQKAMAKTKEERSEI